MKSGGSDTGSFTLHSGIIIRRYLNADAILNAGQSSFSIIASAFTSTTLLIIPFYDFGSATTGGVGATISATSDGRIQLTANLTTNEIVPGTGSALAGAAFTYFYRNNEREVEVNLTWGAAHTGAGSISLSGGGGQIQSTSGPLGYSSGFNTLVYEIFE